jgi:hypothetical protein
MVMITAEIEKKTIAINVRKMVQMALARNNN